VIGNSGQVLPHVMIYTEGSSGRVEAWSTTVGIEGSLRTKARVFDWQHST
jgi:hypothetical protein